MRTLFFAFLPLVACQPTVAPTPYERPERPAHSGEVEQVLGSSTAHFSPASDFGSFIVQATTEPGALLEARVHYADQTWSDWTELEADWIDGSFRTATLVLGERAVGLELRSSGETDFLQASFFQDLPVYDDDGAEVELETEARAISGRWMMPYDVWLAGQNQYLPYKSATSCSGYLTAGARELGNHLVAHTPATSFGGYNCRYIGGTTTLSVHSTGRAIDVFVPTDGGQADNDLGDPIAHWLIENAEHIGISFIVWDRSSWGAHRSGDKHRSYGGVHPHHDHLHIELTEAAAAKNTPFWTGGAASPPPPTGGGSSGGGGSSSGSSGSGGSGAGSSAPPPPPTEDEYLVGDWDGDGIDNLAVRRGNQILMDTDLDGLADITQAYGMGAGEDQYLVGDWDGDGRDNIAVRRGNQILMDTNYDGTHDLEQFYGHGNGEDEYLVGDWNGDGRDRVAVRRGNLILMAYDLDGFHDASHAYGMGAGEDEYLVGDWNGDGLDQVAVRRGNHVLMAVDRDGYHDLSQSYGMGPGEDAYLVGDWNGNGGTNLAVLRGNQVLKDLNYDGFHDQTQAYGHGL